MYSKVDSYIFRCVLFGFLNVFMIIAMIILVTDYAYNLNNSDTPIYSTLYVMPQRLYDIFPTIGLGGTLMALSLLANNSEVIIFRASGFSVLNLSKSVFAISLMGGVISIILSGYIAPMTHRYIDNYTKMSTLEDLWFQESNEIIHIDKINLKSRGVYGITKFILSDGKLEKIVDYKYASYISDTTIQISQFKNIRYLKVPSINKLKVMKEKNYDNTILPELLEYKFSEGNVYDPMLDIKFWKLIFNSLLFIVLSLIPIPLSLGLNRSSLLIVKLIAGAILGFVFYVLNLISGMVALIMHIPVFYGVAFPTLFATILLIILFLKVKEF